MSHRSEASLIRTGCFPFGKLDLTEVGKHLLCLDLRQFNLAIERTAHEHLQLDEVREDSEHGETPLAEDFFDLIFYSQLLLKGAEFFVISTLVK